MMGLHMDNKKDLRRRYCELMTKAKYEYDHGRILSASEADEFAKLARRWAELSMEERP